MVFRSGDSGEDGGVPTLLPNLAVITDGSGQLTTSVTTATEISYSSGLTGNIQAQLNGKQPTGNYITALTGDGTATGPGSVAFTLATVNGSPGSFGSASNTLTATVNGKGLITALAAAAIAINFSQVTGTVPINQGGTGQTTALAAFNALSPLTTKGDILTRDGTNNIRVPVGSDGLFLMADSSQSSGLAWSAASYNSALAIQNLGITATVGSSALTINIVQADGSTAPASGSGAVKVGVRSSTLTSGAFNIRSITSALSLVVSSGSTLGTRNAQAADIYVYLIDNAGTLELAVSQILFDESKLVTTVAEGGAGAADSNAVMYSTTARTNVPFRCVGRLTSTQATAGTYATAISNIAVGNYALFSQTERIYFRYTTSAGPSISNGTFTVIDFNTRDTDTKNIVSGSGSSWVATMPRDGILFLNCSFRFANTTSNGNYVMRVGKNATTYYRPLDFNTSTGGASSTPPTNGGVSFPVSKGDTVALEAYQSTGGSLSLLADSENNYFSGELK